MDPQSPLSHVDTSPDLDEEDIPIPNNLRFLLESLKLLANHPLTPDNHLIWSSQVETLFLANGYAKYLNPQTPTPPPFLLTTDGHRTKNPQFPKYNLINRTLMAALIATISQPLQPLLLRTTTVADIWSTLKARLQSHTRSRIIELKAELHSIKMQGDDLAQYLTRIKYIHDQLEATGSHVDEEDMIIYIMNGLPASFNGFKTAFRLKSEHIDLPTFFSLLSTENHNLKSQAKLSHPDPHLALASTYHRPPSTTYRNPNYKGKNPRPYNPPPSHPTPTIKANPQTAINPLNANFAKSWATPPSLAHTAIIPPPHPNLPKPPTSPHLPNHHHLLTPHLPHTHPPPTHRMIGSSIPVRPPISPTNSKTSTSPAPTMAKKPSPSATGINSLSPTSVNTLSSPPTVHFTSPISFMFLHSNIIFSQFIILQLTITAA